MSTNEKTLLILAGIVVGAGVIAYAVNQTGQGLNSGLSSVGQGFSDAESSVGNAVSSVIEVVGTVAGVGAIIVLSPIGL